MTEVSSLKILPERWSMFMPEKLCGTLSLKQKKKRMSTGERIFDLVLCSLMIALIVISARLSLAIGPIPVTMQTLAVILTGLLLGPKKGWLAPTLYLLMGLTGLPVFSGGGGVGYLIKPTFGFLLGFIPAAYFAGVLYYRKWFKRDAVNVIIGSFMGMVIIYLLIGIYSFCGFSNRVGIGGFGYALTKLAVDDHRGLLKDCRFNNDSSFINS